MVEKLYYVDSYLDQFEAKVTKVVGEKIFLSRTAFYPGGGGQQNDIGEIDEAKVTVVGREQDDIYHTVPEGSFVTGQTVRGEIDWPHRYNLMKGHTAQHILFRAMQEQSPELTVRKVDITPEKKSLFFNGVMTWEMLRTALTRTNEIILSDLDVKAQIIKKDSPELENVRIKADRIKGEAVRVMRIGDFDSAACGGLHVARTSEIGGVTIEKLVSGGQASDWEVQFDLGFSGLIKTSQLSLTAISISNMLGCPYENIESTVRNLKEEAQDLTEKLEQACSRQLDSLIPEKIGDFQLYSAILTGSDRKTLNEYASKLIRKKGTIVMLADVSDTAYMLLGCNSKISLDCASLLSPGLEMIGGRGGGKKNFAMGGGSEISKLEEAFNSVKQTVTEKIASEFSCS
ncbi:MAG: DHHA1 domain-containing protein [Thermoplasmata archaeon]|nr:DHHA1 domain-containing protein [Thermoplasmata archaeon]